MRVFVAAVPPRNVIDDLAAFLDGLGTDDQDTEDQDPDDRALRWTPPQQWHLTLSFLSQVPLCRLDELIEGLSRAARRRTSMVLNLTGAVAFPRPARFHPHLTLARLRQTGDATRWTSRLATYRGPSWPLTEIVLVESHLGAGRGGRARHEEVAKFSLG